MFDRKKTCKDCGKQFKPSKGKTQRFCDQCGRDRKLKRKRDYINKCRREFRDKMKAKFEEEKGIGKSIDVAKAIGDVNKSMTTKEIRKKQVWREALEQIKKEKLPIRLMDKSGKEILPTSPLCRNILMKLMSPQQGDYWSFMEGRNKLTREEVFHIAGSCQFCQRIYAAYKSGSVIGVALWKPELTLTHEEKARLRELDQQKLNEQLGEISEEEQWLQKYEEEVPEEEKE